jgi:hypothetical protein
MQCTIYKVTEVIKFDDGAIRYIAKTPMKVSEKSNIKDVRFTFNDFKGLEVIKIENW